MGLREKHKGDIPRRKIDLEELGLELGNLFRERDLTIHLFGSRKDQTGSVRSDVDLLVELGRRASQDEMDAIWKLEPYLDVFVLDRGVAASLVNESQLRDKTNEDLIAKLGAGCLMRHGDWQAEAKPFREQIVLAERNPAASLVPLYDLVDAVPAERADLLVVTALTEEYEAMLAALGETTTEPSVLTELEDNKNSPWRIRVLNLHEMDSVGAALKTADAMRRSKPSHVVLVGICGGISGRCNLLDVVIPQSVIYYEPGKITPEGTKGGFAVRHCDADARNRFSVWARTPNTPKVLADGELMACGEKVIADESARDVLANTHRKLTAIDMESYGVVRAAEAWKTPVTVIKSVCDLADAEKSDDLHDQARKTAARVFVEGVKAGVFRAEK